VTDGVRFPLGSRVRARTIDPDHHTRLPRYLRGHTGEVVAAAAPEPLPDDVARGRAEPRVETVYAVRFHGSDLWGSDPDSSHTVIADLWECYLEEAR
jgi:nitrile hydratase beta subunit-like protein